MIQNVPGDNRSPSAGALDSSESRTPTPSAFSTCGTPRFGVGSFSPRNACDPGSGWSTQGMLVVIGSAPRLVIAGNATGAKTCGTDVLGYHMTPGYVLFRTDVPG